MKYVPKNMPEGINVAKGHPLKDLARLLCIIGVLLYAIYIALGWSTDLVLSFVPLEKEVEWFQKPNLNIEKNAKSLTDKANSQFKLQKFTNDLWSNAEPQSPVSIETKILVSSSPNAFMELGGRLSITQSILQDLKSDNAIAFVICHELGHFKNRHVARQLGRGLSLALLMSALSMNSNTQQALQPITNVLGLSFSRKQELEADTYALNCMKKHYGHTGGASDFFKLLQKQDLIKISENVTPLKYGSTHPVTADRLENIDQWRVHHRDSKSKKVEKNSFSNVL